MAVLVIHENGNKIRDFLTPLRDISDFSALEINSYSPGDVENLVVEFPGIIPEFESPILLAYSPSEVDTKKLEKMLEENPNIFGLIDLEKGLKLQLPIIREFLKIKDNSLDLSNIEKKIKKLKAETSSQLETIKKAFKKLVPVRTSSNNGINIYVKFSSGMSQGGEFFDFLNVPMESAIIWDRAKTYAGSNNFLDHFQSWEVESYDVPNLETFIKNLNPEEGQEIFLARIDLKTLTFSGFNVSNCFFYFKGDKEIKSSSFTDLRPFNIRLERGERFIILSSGAMESFKELNPELDLTKKLNELALLDPREALDEIFFELKRNLKKKFLPADAAIILVEVDKNVIFQV
jgi:hypothetical protein